METPQTLYVVRAVETDTLTFAAVAACTACLLIVPLQTLWNIIMYHKTDIRLVDTHTESNRSYDHLAFLHQKSILVRAAGRCIHAGVVCAGADTVHLQHLRQILYFLPRQTIYNAALAFHAADVTNQVFIYIRGLRPYFVIQVRTVETALENSRVRHA